MLESFSFGTLDAMAIVSYGLIAASYSCRRMHWLRILTVAACTIDIVIYFAIRPGQPLWIQILFNIAFLVINIHHLFADWREGNLSRLPDILRQVYHTSFHRLAPAEFNRLASIGHLTTLSPGEVFAEAGKPLEHIGVVTEGALHVSRGEKTVGSIGKFATVGEISYFTGGRATATVKASQQSQILILPKRDVIELLDKHPEMRGTFHAALANDLAGKLAA